MVLKKFEISLDTFEGVETWIVYDRSEKIAKRKLSEWINVSLHDLEIMILGAKLKGK